MRRATVALVLLGLLGITYLVLFTSILGVRNVDVVGAQTVTPDQVRAAAAIEPGTPLVRLDTDGVAARVSAIPRVASVDVRRSLPGTVEIIVSERTPVMVAARPDGVHLVDSTGADFAVVKTAPAGLPALQVDRVAADDPSTRAALAVVAAIPTQLRPLVATVAAPTPGGVTLSLTDGRTVRWGGAENSVRKGAVLGPLLTRPGKVYDVAAPDLPTVS